MELLKFNSSCQSAEFLQKSRSRIIKQTKKKFDFYGFNPRMIPPDINPVCLIIKNDQGEVCTPSHSEDELDQLNTDELTAVADSDEDMFDTKIKRRGIAAKMETKKKRGTKKSTTLKRRVTRIDEDEGEDKVGDDEEEDKCEESNVEVVILDSSSWEKKPRLLTLPLHQDQHPLLISESERRLEK